MKTTLWAAVLSAAPFLFGQSNNPAPAHHSDDLRDRASYLLYFSLEESDQQIFEKFGVPNQVADHAGQFRVLQFHFNGKDKHDFSHTLCVRQSDGKLISIARNTDHEEDVDSLFPPELTTVHYWPSKEKPQAVARVRRMTGDRVLIAMVTAKQQSHTRQLTLMRRSSLDAFLPWIVVALEKAPPPAHAAAESTKH